MSWRRVRPADVPAVDAFLMRHIETSVFLVTNLRRYGPEGGTAPYAMTYWMTGDPVTGVIAQSTEGIVMAQWPAPGDWTAPAALLPAPVTGVIGHAGQLRGFLAATGLEDVATRLNAFETLFSLDLQDVIDQPGPGTLRPMSEKNRAAVMPWRTDYAITTLGEPEDTAPARASAEITNYINAGSHRLLVEDDTPLAMTGFNAVVDDLVQVGGVYTPPRLRGRGFARRAVALHLAQARDAGARRAILFADNPSAMAAYRAIGFQPIGRFVLIIFEDGQRPQ